MDIVEGVFRVEELEFSFIVFYLCDFGDLIFLKFGFFICRFNIFILCDCNKKINEMVCGIKWFLKMRGIWKVNFKCSIIKVRYFRFLVLLFVIKEIVWLGF